MFDNTLANNKLMKTILDAATLTGLAAGISWIVRKIAKENLTADPSSNVMNYVKFIAVMAGSIWLKTRRLFLITFKDIILFIKWPALRL